MAAPVIHCDQCGVRLENAKLMTELAIIKPDDKTIPDLGHQRMFEGVCPEHGRRIRGFPGGGHSTILESGLKKRFSKADRKALLAVLTGQDRNNFQNALHGRFVWDENDAAAWEAILNKER